MLQIKLSQSEQENARMRDVGRRMRDKLLHLFQRGGAYLSATDFGKEQSKKRVSASDLFRKETASEIRAKNPSKTLLSYYFYPRRRQQHLFLKNF